MQNVILSQIPINDLVSLIAFEITTRMQKTEQAKVKPSPEPDQKFTGDKELAKYLGCTIQTINRLKRTGALPFHRFGRRYYYLKSEVDQAFKKPQGLN